MTTFAKWLVVLLVIAGAGGAGYWLGHRGARAGGNKDDEKAAAPEAKPVASVGVITLRRRTISDEITAYGIVIAPPGEIRVISVPFEARVTKVLVMAGQVISPGQTLIEVEGSAATALAIEEAQNAMTAAERDLQLVQQRYEQKLATNSDLFTAQNALKSAQARRQSLPHGSTSGPQELKSESSGMVSKLDVQVGQVVPIGSPLVEIAGQDQVAVKLGVEPKDAATLQVGQTVALAPVDGAVTISAAGKIRQISQRVDPITRLVDVIVSPPPNAKLMLESSVVGRIARPGSSTEGLVVPRDAVLPEDDGSYTLFTVADGHASKHAVKIGIETTREVQIISDDLKDGDQVVVVGNHELEDGMAVQVEPVAAQPDPAESPSTQPVEIDPASTQPTTNPDVLQTGGLR